MGQGHLLLGSAYGIHAHAMWQCWMWAYYLGLVVPSAYHCAFAGVLPIVALLLALMCGDCLIIPIVIKHVAFLWRDESCGVYITCYVCAQLEE